MPGSAFTSQSVFMTSNDISQTQTSYIFEPTKDGLGLLLPCCVRFPCMTKWAHCIHFPSLMDFHVSTKVSLLTSQSLLKHWLTTRRQGPGHQSAREQSSGICLKASRTFRCHYWWNGIPRYTARQSWRVIASRRGGKGYCIRILPQGYFPAPPASRTCFFTHSHRRTSSHGRYSRCTWPWYIITHALIYSFC